MGMDTGTVAMGGGILATKNTKERLLEMSFCVESICVV